MNSFLETIVRKKREEVALRRARNFKDTVEKATLCKDRTRSFIKAISSREPVALIAEIKLASPSVGDIVKSIDLEERASIYEAAGACAISVITEANFFKGEISFLERVKRAVSVPVLQKDFVIDPFQIYEARASGADALLLIASILRGGELRDFVNLTKSLKMTPLVEIHGPDDLEKTRGLDLPLIGINNRDLETFDVDLKTTFSLMRMIPDGAMVVSESGIKTSSDIKLLREAGVRAALVGEVLMRALDPGAKIRELLRI